MRRWIHYLQRASELIGTYKGETPLAPVLKAYFRERRQMGATDRRIVSDLVYGYYRLGHAETGLSVEERLLLAYFLTRKGPSPLIEALRPEWFLQPPALPLAEIFPWKDALSEGIDPLVLAASHLEQPEFYIRVRPGQGAAVREVLTGRGIDFQEMGEDALRLPSGFALQDLLPPDKSYVVQDLGSQQVGALIREAFGKLGLQAPLVWDCCAGSGGKSLLLKDILPGARLTVSDIRTSILHNLDNRFAAAGIRYQRAFAADLSNSLPAPAVYDLILADVPCTGSGTWSRAPEQLYFFTKEKIGEYARLQRSILRNILPSVRPGGFLLLVTCSVFAEENESNVAMLIREGLTLTTQRVFAGSDTLFGALLQRPA